MKCQSCTRIATWHITEVLDEGDYEEVHLCEECVQKYLYKPQAELPGGGLDPEEIDPVIETGTTEMLAQQCPVCGIRFVEFRNSGRLGCAHDYEQFREDLLPLLDNIHGDTKHCGKVPRSLPPSTRAQTELVELRKQLQQAIGKEAYEEAAQLRDRIRQLEES